jgi:hypothetical protein
MELAIAIFGKTVIICMYSAFDKNYNRNNKHLKIEKLKIQIEFLRTQGETHINHP